MEKWKNQSEKEKMLTSAGFQKYKKFKKIKGKKEKF